MKIDQIAFYASTPEIADHIKRLFGLERAKWVTDTVTADSSVHGAPPETNKAFLQFNYDLGIELEILTYIEGSHWHEHRREAMSYHQPRPSGAPSHDDPFISHVGIHLSEEEEMPDLPLPLVQETWTRHHTNSYVNDRGRRYHYRIYQVQRGHYIKYIKRVEGE